MLLCQCFNVDEVMEQHVSVPDGKLTDYFKQLSPVISVEAISEVYEKDFWDLWERADKKLEGKWDTTEVLSKLPMEVKPIGTEQYMNVSGDDLIYYWQEDNNIQFSQELRAWFRELKSEYEEINNRCFKESEMLEMFFAIMAEADKRYQNVYAFLSSFQELLAHLGDIRYQKLWRLCWLVVTEKPKEEEAEREYGGNRTNEVKARRYLALMANTELRRKVLGI